MLELIGKKIKGDITEHIGDKLEISYTSNDKEYYVITDGKPHPLKKFKNLLVWDIPKDVDKKNLKIKIQAIHPEKRNTLYITPEVTIKTNSKIQSTNVNSGIQAFTTTSTLTYDSDYPFYDMADQHSTIKVNNRKIEMPNNYQIAVSGDSLCQLLVFEISKYFDGVNLADKACTISYINADKEHGKAMAVNVNSNDEFLYIGWLLDSNITKSHGNVSFKIEFTGYNEFEQLYIWQTVPATLKIEEGLSVDDGEVVERYPTIIEDLVIKLRALELRVADLDGLGSSPDTGAPVWIDLDNL